MSMVWCRSAAQSAMFVHPYCDSSTGSHDAQHDLPNQCDSLVETFATICGTDYHGQVECGLACPPDVPLSFRHFLDNPSKFQLQAVCIANAGSIYCFCQAALCRFPSDAVGVLDSHISDPLTDTAGGIKHGHYFRWLTSGHVIQPQLVDHLGHCRPGHSSSTV